MQEIDRVVHCAANITVIGAAGFKKNEFKPHLRKYWKIPPEGNAAFVAQMEEVLEIYHLSYDKDYPVVCFDDSNKQLVGEVRTPIPCKSGAVERIVEPLAGKRHVGITATRKRVDFALHIREMLDERYPKAEKVLLIMDNLNMHTVASLYETFPAPEAQGLAKRLEIHHPPKHGSWMNMEEIELSALKGQCLNRRIPDMQSMRTKVWNWQMSRNNKNSKIKWQFTTVDARVKLNRLYPQF